MSSPRSGILLIVVAGIMALLAVLTLTFITQSRNDSREGEAIMAHTQTRVMLAAALNYIQESSRIGWDLEGSAWSAAYSGGGMTSDSIFSRAPHMHPGGFAFPTDANNEVHELAFGWIDVRDGSVGPRTFDYDGDGEYDPRFDDTPRVAFFSSSVDAPLWPAVHGMVRVPMYRMQRPPYAVEPRFSVNPISQEFGAVDSDGMLLTGESHAMYAGIPLLKNPDPVPDLSGRGSTAAWDWHKAGDRRPLLASVNRGWFRLFRESPATFTITVGSGGTQGFKDWSEVQYYGAEASWGNDRFAFETARAEEVVLWYRAEWSAAATGGDIAAKTGDTDADSWSKSGVYNRDSWRNPRLEPFPRIVNQGGTFTWIQRLREAPTYW
ncbi:MAG: hypothetical protein PF961_11200 [Planctomycetota bacterium]|jgi:type II secretory pathway pseudopilin PulG|nr:hypothetical protein [Planctomycetota bacterium]